MDYLGILDRIHSRAIVIDDGTSTAALIGVDAGAVPDNIWQGGQGLDRSDPEVQKLMDQQKQMIRLHPA